MKIYSTLALCALVTAFSAQMNVVAAHGRLLTPPSRASMWRRGFNTPEDYDDNQGFCGGRQVQASNGGLCGICGDPYNASPRLHEAPGGLYATGAITQTYRPGQDIDIEVQITANHKGYFYFRLCANNNTASDPSQDCFDQTAVLPVLPHLGPHYVLPTTSPGTSLFKIRLPDNVWCSQCILQWTYWTGNSWGICEDGTGALGCGPQEMFRACSDISIQGVPVDHGNNVGSTTTAGPAPTTTTTSPTVPTPTPATPHTTTTIGNGGPKICNPTPVYASQPGMAAWCMNVCNLDPPYCPASHCVCSNDQTTTTTTTTTTTPGSTPTTTTAGTGGPKTCNPTPAYASQSGMDTWCTTVCNHTPPYCPASHCVCN